MTNFVTAEGRADNSCIYTSDFDLPINYYFSFNEHQIFITNKGITVAISYCVQEKFTDKTHNILAIGVSKSYQRKGIATEMMQYIEQRVKSKNGRIIIVETSSDAAQSGARNFYQNIGYLQEAIINDFWKDGVRQNEWLY